MRKSDYTAFRGKKKLVNYFSDSDLSDFEIPSPAKRIDLTVDEDNTGNTMLTTKSLKEVISRLEKCIDKSDDIQQLRHPISRLESEKGRAEGDARSANRALEDMKECLTCIICKSVAPFPWIITPCCKIIICKECDRWLQMDASCPHCRATVKRATCIEMSEIRPMQELITT